MEIVVSLLSRPPGTCSLRNRASLDSIPSRESSDIVARFHRNSDSYLLLESVLIEVSAGLFFMELPNSRLAASGLQHPAGSYSIACNFFRTVPTRPFRVHK